MQRPSKLPDLLIWILHQLATQSHKVVHIRNEAHEIPQPFKLCSLEINFTLTYIFRFYDGIQRHVRSCSTAEKIIVLLASIGGERELAAPHTSGGRNWRLTPVAIPFFQTSCAMLSSTLVHVVRCSSHSCKPIQSLHSHPLAYS